MPHLFLNYLVLVVYSLATINENYVHGAGFVANQTIQVEAFTSAQNSYEVLSDCSSDPSITYVGSIGKSTVLSYNPVDFGEYLDGGFEMVTLRLANSYQGPPLQIDLHYVPYDTEVITGIKVGYTGSGNCDFYTLSLFLGNHIYDMQNIYFTFPSSVENALRLDWFQFNQTAFY